MGPSKRLIEVQAVEMDCYRFSVRLEHKTSDSGATKLLFAKSSCYEAVALQKKRQETSQGQDFLNCGLYVLVKAAVSLSRFFTTTY